MKKNLIFLLALLSVVLPLAGQTTRTAVVVNNEKVIVSNYIDKDVTVSGKSELHITGTSSLLSNTEIDLTSMDAWLFFDNLRPQFVVDNLLAKVKVNGQVAANKSNCRVAIYAHGTVVMPYPQTIQPLEVFSENNFGGESASYYPLTYYKGLSSMENKIRSFKLKRGYMATLANNSDGTGYSRVFIADDADIEVPVIAALLDRTVSFIRVLPWEYVTKKGWCGTGSGGANDVEVVDGTWWYSWSADQESKINQEYVPIKQNLGWPGWDQINNKQNVSHLLGYNEPNRPDQSNMTVAQALAAWPEYMKSGLRLGSPSPSDPFGSNGAWLYEFLDSCKARNYRVDYIAIHAYWAKSPQSWYNDLKYVHERTGLPIWITEWNNGANWTNETSWPTADRSYSDANATKQLNDIKAILNVLDTASFVERYSIYNWVQDARAMILNGSLTKAGQYYKDNKSVLAFNRKKEVIPTYNFRNPSLNIAFGSQSLTVSINDPNGEYYNGYIIEKKVGDGEYQVVSELVDVSTKTFNQLLDLANEPKVRYRARARYKDGSLSAYTNEVGMDVTQGYDVQYGNVSYSNVGWNNVFFTKPYTAVPTIILGAPTNRNSGVYMSPRPRLISYSSRFNIQLAPWAYQNTQSLVNEETVPYFVTAHGNFDFGGLKAVANRVQASGNWTTITFDTPFETVPVVFVSQISPATSHPLAVRVRNVSTTGFQLKLQKESAVAMPLNTENISYFAITQGTGVLNNHKLIVGKTADNVIKSNAYTRIDFGESIENPVFITQMQTCNDDTVTAVMRVLSMSSSFANVMKQRERSTGNTVAANETAGWMVIEPFDILQSVKTPSAATLRFYPNPVKDVMHLTHKLNENERFRIYNLYGQLQKEIVTSAQTIDVSELTPGTYLIHSEKSGSNKFVKF
ncbi:MAG: T9SS type A sorting domain-containing protein [Paludibacteraceae bacterium]|nr:T9SS type A sorting domain-containing protein [Paludibacteraceae bacterium]